MNNFFRPAIAWRPISFILAATATTIFITPTLKVSAFEQQDLEQLKASRICHDDCDLSNAELTEIYLVNANLEKANLQGSNLEEVNLKSALLINSNLSEANLRGAYLRETNFQQADLRNTKLSRADFKGAILTEANIQGTQLTTARNLTATQIKSSCNWEEAIYDRDELANKAFIIQLKADIDSNPLESINCSIWD